MEARIGKIQNTTISFPNLWARLLGWSNVRIATAGGPPIVLPRIANGPRVHAVINELVAENRQRAALQELQIAGMVDDAGKVGVGIIDARHQPVAEIRQRARKAGAQLCRRFTMIVHRASLFGAEQAHAACGRTARQLPR